MDKHDDPQGESSVVEYGITSKYVEVFSIPRKRDKLRAVHLKSGPIGQFIYTMLKMDGKVCDISHYAEGTLCLQCMIHKDKVKEFEEITGFGLEE